MQDESIFDLLKSANIKFVVIIYFEKLLLSQQDNVYQQYAIVVHKQDFGRVKTILGKNHGFMSSLKKSIGETNVEPMDVHKQRFGKLCYVRELDRNECATFRLMILQKTFKKAYQDIYGSVYECSQVKVPFVEYYNKKLRKTNTPATLENITISIHQN